MIIDDSLKLEIYEFFAIHSYLMWPDSSNLESFNELVEYCDNDVFGDKAIRYLNKNFNSIQERVVTNLLQALTARRTLSVERNLKDSDQNRFSSGVTPDSFFELFK